MKRSMGTLGLLLILSLAARVAPAQPGFVNLPLNDAISEAARQQKLLVVVFATNPSTVKIAEQVWSNAATSAWVRRHALGVRVTDQATFKPLNESGLAPPAGIGFKADPLVYKTGRVLRVFGSNGMQARVGFSGQGPSPASVAMALRLEWTLRGMSDQWWYQSHLRAIGAGASVRRPLLFARDEPGASGVKEPEAGPGGRVDVLAVWERARQAYGAGDMGTATGLYTWLWERGAACDGAMDGPILFLATAEMAVIAEKHAPGRARFTALRDAMLEGIDVGDAEELFRYLMLCRVIGDHVENLDFIDSALNDIDAAAMMPQADRQAWELALPRLHFRDPMSLTKSPQNFVNRLKQRLSGARPKRMDEEEWKRFAVFARWLGARDGARVYASLLAAGKDAEATAVAATVLEIVPGAETGRVLAATALAAHRARAEQRAWVSQGDPLRAALEEMLRK